MLMQVLTLAFYFMTQLSTLDVLLHNDLYCLHGPGISYREFAIKHEEGIPQQEGRFDNGVYVMKFMESLACGVPLNVMVSVL